MDSRDLFMDTIGLVEHFWELKYINLYFGGDVG
jgi:hypothetical protein